MSSNSLPVSVSRDASKVGHTGAFGRKTGVRSGQSRPLRVSQGKIAQVQALLMQGQSQRKIGRMLHVSPMTVAKIAKAEDLQLVIKKVQERIFGSLMAIADTLIAGALADPYLAYQLLKDFGVIPDSGVRFLHILKKISPRRRKLRSARKFSYCRCHVSTSSTV
jgi:hypothetical protein